MHDADQNPATKAGQITVCQVLHSLCVGGAEVLAREFALAANPEFRTVFACLDDIGPIGEQLRDEGYQVECFGRQPGLDRTLIRRLSAFCDSENVDVVHAHQYTPFVYAALSRLSPWWKSYRRNPPVLMTEHGRHYPDIRKPKRVFANQFLFRRWDRCVAVGRNVKQALIEKEGIAANKIDVVYNGIDIDRFRRCNTMRTEARRELGLSDSDIAIFQVARINALKDHATAIRTWTHLADLPHAKLILVGDGELRGEVETQIQQSGLQDQVRLLGTRHDVSRIINAADVTLLTSISEGIPLMLIEAMANGLPCVASNVGGIPEVIEDRVTGDLVDVSDDQTFAQKIRELALSPQQRSAYGSKARLRAAEHFSDKAMHSKYHEMYRMMGSIGRAKIAPTKQIPE